MKLIVPIEDESKSRRQTTTLRACKVDETRWEIELEFRDQRERA